MAPCFLTRQAPRHQAVLVNAAQTEHRTDALRPFWWGIDFRSPTDLSVLVGTVTQTH